MNYLRLARGYKVQHLKTKGKNVNKETLQILLVILLDCSLLSGSWRGKFLPAYWTIGPREREMRPKIGCLSVEAEFLPGCEA